MLTGVNNRPKGERFKRYYLNEAEMKLADMSRNKDGADPKSESQRYLDIIDGALSKHKRKLFSRSYSEEVKESLIEALEEERFSAEEAGFTEVISIARSLKNPKIRIPAELLKKTRGLKEEICPDEGWEVSLNCYDYDRLKEEMKRLSKMAGPASIRVYCPLLCDILEEAKAGEESSYPARHLPLSRFKGKSAWNSQCLRLMDEILYTTQSYYSVDEMETAIVELAKEYGLDVPEKKFSSDNIRKHFSTLNKMIGIEHTRGGDDRYCNMSYQRTGIKGKGHQYIIKEDGNPVSAFVVELSTSEMARLHKEIARLRAERFRGMTDFEERFPLISIICDMGSMARENTGSNVATTPDIQSPADISQIKDTLQLSIHTSPFETGYVNYYNAKNYVRQRVEMAITRHCTLICASGEGDKTLIPVSIKEYGDKWSLIAKKPDTGETTVVTPEDLADYSIGAQVSE